MTLDFLINPATVNIFTDASIRKVGRGNYLGCYGAIAIYGTEMIDEEYRIIGDTTSNNSEISAIRSGVVLAEKYSRFYPTINLFSDSQLCIFGLRDRLWKWEMNPEMGLMTKSGTPVISQDVFMEIVNIILDYNLRINFFHQKGHVTNHIKSLREAEHVFKVSNFIRSNVDINLIRYISKWNNTVDMESRHRLSTMKCGTEAHECLYFDTTEEFNRVKYRQLSRPYKDKGEPI